MEIDFGKCYFYFKLFCLSKMKIVRWFYIFIKIIKVEIYCKEVVKVENIFYVLVVLGKSGRFRFRLFCRKVLWCLILFEGNYIYEFFKFSNVIKVMLFSYGRWRGWDKNGKLSDIYNEWYVFFLGWNKVNLIFKKF